MLGFPDDGGVLSHEALGQQSSFFRMSDGNITRKRGIEIPKIFCVEVYLYVSMTSGNAQRSMSPHCTFGETVMKSVRTQLKP